MKIDQKEEMSKLRELAVERIFLVPDRMDGDLCYLWCDDPAPTEFHIKGESIEYVRRDVYDAALEREQALAAHVERAKAAVEQLENDCFAEDIEFPEMFDFLRDEDETPTTSLTRRDLIKRAEGAQMVSEDAKMRIEQANAVYPKFNNSGYRQCIYTADRVAANLRQRAQELTP